MKRTPHSEPHFVAVVREDGRRKYHRCNTRTQALQHKPYLIEHVNGYGQVVRRERLQVPS